MINGINNDKELLDIGIATTFNTRSNSKIRFEYIETISIKNEVKYYYSFSIKNK